MWRKPEAQVSSVKDSGCRDERNDVPKDGLVGEAEGSSSDLNRLESYVSTCDQQE